MLLGQPWLCINLLLLHYLNLSVLGTALLLLALSSSVVSSVWNYCLQPCVLLQHKALLEEKFEKGSCVL